MRAAVLRAAGAPLTIEEVQLEDPAPGELLVRIEAAGVCHSDYHYMTGDIACPMPIVLGHEGAGIVEARGPSSGGTLELGAPAMGDRVALLWRPRCGRCTACVTGNPVLCEFGPRLAATGGLMDGTSRLRSGAEKLHHFLGVSCFAEEVVVSETSVVKVPDGVSPAIAAIAGCAVITGVGAMLNAVHDAAGRAVVIIGAGGVGLSAVMGARLIGADPIIVVDRDPSKFELARRLGATHTVDASASELVTAVLAVVPHGAPWVVDAVGAAATLEQGLACVSAAGTLIAIGLGRVGSGFNVPINNLVQRQKRIVGSLYGSSNPLVDLPRIFSLYLAGRLPLDELLGETTALDQVNEAYSRLASGSVGRTVIVP